MFNPNDKKGTGFTNINRVLSVNKGNQLGSTVAGGVTKQANNVKTQTQQSQDKFNQDANANRLDSQENTQKRDNVIGRFNEKPDDSNFKVSSGLQDSYNQQKQTYQTKLAGEQAKNPARPENFDQANYDKLLSLSRDAGANRGDTNWYNTDRMNEMRDAIQKAGESDSFLYNANDGRAVLDQGMNLFNVANSMKTAYDKQAPAREAEYQKLLADKTTNVSAIEKQMYDADQGFNAASNAEKQAYLASQAYNPSEQELADFNKFRAGVYGGPRELSDYQTLLGNASEVEQLGNLTRSDGGRQELLRRFVGGEGYNQGQQRLDNLLLAQSPQGINDVRKNTRGLEKTVVEGNKAAGNTAKELDSRAKIFANDTVSKLTDKRNPIDANINTQLAAIQAKEADRATFASKMNDTLLGKTEDSAQMDAGSRLQQVLQNSREGGYVPQYQNTRLDGADGNGGLLNRGTKLGLDNNSMLAARLKNTAGSNINRGGAANAFQETQLNSLDKLLGKSVEFATPGEDYESGNIDFDTLSLDRYLKGYGG